MESPLDNEVVVGKIESAEAFEDARKPKLAKLEVDLGTETAQSAAQLLYHHDIDELPGTRVLCVTDLGTVNIAGYTSEVLTVGVPGEDGNPVLVTPTKDVPLGGGLY
ncbi:tRNA-binding protein [Halosegnis rubeus]|mgnify:FL=1|jgi:tRNA-binding protein|uniref:tRNA-binding protein n=1 Tax=Halosegnis rubeus TaxID=2212850 RepID=A0A5N5ULN5_9EURY|nr:tRNA-binding protein [Halosegnis rubeus]KAB7515743.1 tRNA-binding protein [Halosegnis rubeus]KAB7517042.1 tRNA-binding protein [Halosegnis rubeus]KAB7519830.1 tRNA-binding protein [Halosegnis rubeus]